MSTRKDDVPGLQPKALFLVHRAAAEFDEPVLRRGSTTLWSAGLPLGIIELPVLLGRTASLSTSSSEQADGESDSHFSKSSSG